MDLLEAPESVQLAFENGAFISSYDGHTLTATLDRLRIHAAVVVG
jgi:hypothetical protein